MRVGYFLSLFLLAVSVSAVMFPGTLGAQERQEEVFLEDTAMEAQAREIMKGIRCLVCQNQSIEESNADLALDLRRIVREHVARGDNRKTIEAFLVARYGDWVLLAPPFKLGTLLLWLSPLIFLMLGAIGLYRFQRSRALVVPENDLSEAEASRLQDLLEDED